MGTINHGYVNRVKYVLSCIQLEDEIEIIAPIGWDNDEKEFARNAEYHGIIAKFSNNLKFIEDGADFINTAFDLYDVMAQIKLTKYELHPKTDKPVRSYWGYLDLTTRIVENGQVAVKFNSGGLEEDIKSRESESVEVDRETSINGLVIDPIQEKEMILKGRRIFLKSKWEVKDTDNAVNLGVFNNDGDTENEVKPVPLFLASRSHEEAQTSFSSSANSESKGSPGLMILANMERPGEVDIIGKGLEFFFKITESDWQWALFAVCVTVYANGTSYDLKNNGRTTVYHVGEGSTTNTNLWSIHNKTIKVPDFNIRLALDEGDSVAVEFFIKADLKNFTENRARFYVQTSNIKGIVYAEEDSNFAPTTTKFYLAHDLLDQLTTICANKKNIFKSEFLGRTDLGYTTDGPGAYLGVTHGFAVRGFTKLPLPDPDNGVENLYKPMTTSLKDAVSSLIATHNLGLGIEEINGKEYLRLEELKYFYNHTVTIKLPNPIKKVKRTCAADYYFPSVEMGFEDGYENEEAQGLDEPNGQSNFTTYINKGKNVYSKLSKYIGGSYAKEFTRRKPFGKFPTLDNKHDNSVFLMDLKKVGSTFEERVWQDDFTKAPTGIFSPETANNLRLSPFNMLLRHSWVIASCLTKFATEYVRYGSSTSNSHLKTQLIGGYEYAENGTIINNELSKARFIPEWIEFEHECNFEIMQTVQGATVIQGKKIPNFYGTVEFINEFNTIEKGFLFNLKPNGKGQWKVLKSNR